MSPKYPGILNIKYIGQTVVKRALINDSVSLISLIHRLENFKRKTCITESIKIGHFALEYKSPVSLGTDSQPSSNTKLDSLICLMHGKKDKTATRTISTIKNIFNKLTSFRTLIPLYRHHNSCGKNTVLRRYNKVTSVFLCNTRNNRHS